MQQTKTNKATFRKLLRGTGISTIGAVTLVTNAIMFSDVKEPKAIDHVALLAGELAALAVMGQGFRIIEES